MQNQFTAHAGGGQAGCLTYTLISSTRPLCKVMSLAPTGELIRRPAADMTEGEALTRRAANLSELAAQLDALAPNESPTWGVTGHERVSITTLDGLAQNPGAIARSGRFFQFATAPGVMMLDVDSMPPGWGDVCDPDSIRTLLALAALALADAPMLIRPSSTAGIFAADGRTLAPLSKWRVYVPVTSAAEIPAAGKRLCNLLWAAGLAWWHIGNSGQLLDRTILDASVWGPERLDFATAPELRDGLQRPHIAARPYGTGLFDLGRVVLSPDAAASAAAARKAMRPAAAARAAPIRAAWALKRARVLAPKTGRTAEAVTADLVRGAEQMELAHDFPLTLQNGETVTVGAVLADQTRYNGLRLPDPLEPEYQGDSRIAVLCLDGSPHVYSHAHGGVRYTMHDDPARLFSAPLPPLPPAPGLEPPPQAASAAHRHIYSALPLNTARVFIAEKFPGDALRYWQGCYYRWRDGAWSEVGRDDPHAWVYRFLEERPERNDYTPNQANVGKVLDALKAAAHLDSGTAPPAWLDAEGGPPPCELVACVNGLLHVPTGRLLPPTPRLFNLNALPVAFNPAALAPVAWLAFFDQVWPEDPEAIQALQEMFGYLLTPDTSQQKIFLIVGPKRSGKGTMARVLTALLGPGNVASPTLNSMAEAFGKQPLIGKLAAVISDARIGGRTDQQTVAEDLLRISGEDQVEVNRKFLAPLAVRLGVRFVLLSNELPKIADASGAMASRFVILRMTESFLGREDHGLTTRLLLELPGILNWALQGWHRLRQRGHFAIPRSSAALTEELADLGSPISAFVRDVCTISPGAEVRTDDLYQAWRAWCSQQGIERAGTKPQFCRDLHATLPALKRRQLRGEDARVPAYSGIGLLPGTGGTGWHGQFSTAAPVPLLSPS